MMPVSIIYLQIAIVYILALVQCTHAFSTIYHYKNDRSVSLSSTLYATTQNKLIPDVRAAVIVPGFLTGSK